MFAPLGESSCWQVLSCVAHGKGDRPIIIQNKQVKKMFVQFVRRKKQNKKTEKGNITQILEETRIYKVRERLCVTFRFELNALGR